MTNLTIEIPDDLARGLEGIAAVQRKSVQQLALEQLRSLISVLHAGSPAALLRVMYERPHLSAEDVEELDAAILAGRLAVAPGDDGPRFRWQSEICAARSHQPQDFITPDCYLGNAPFGPDCSIAAGMPGRLKS